ncbi:putative metal-binding protein [Desulfosalsimonas propionicica]|uniref:Putative metal-binding protein n=1 Tax=Desulfosalsimonas propionicica TaxID=332175 RepID=A0A7W0HLA0_9BACT|nr:DUF2284 domain-containing protein [Desulfosalsimonas propionicica]MBA2882065.1 putative metal-binding protein [Desulfosalsimonas propionicica]
MNPQYIEDLATSYWRSELLFTAVEQELFTRIGAEGRPVAELAFDLGLDPESTKRYLRALSALGLIFLADGYAANTKFSQKYLVRDAADYQGDSILWRKYLAESWKSLNQCLEKGTRVLMPPANEPPEAVDERRHRYSRAMDCIAKNKIKQILPLFANMEISGDILDVGSGLGAFSVGFLEQFSQAAATLLDMAPVLGQAAETHAGQPYADRMVYQPGNVLDAWELPHKRYQLVIFSNIVHAFGDAEVGHLISQGVTHLAKDGLLLIHDFFMEHNPEKATLSDLNMLANTYNGRVYEAAWLRQKLEASGLKVTELVSLDSDTGVLVAARQQRLDELCLSRFQQLTAQIRALGFQEVRPVDTPAIRMPEWVGLKCEFGCEYYGLPQCPPNCIAPEKTRAMLADYTKCLLLQGSPPTADFQRLVLRAEKTAFKKGYHKAFCLWAGPCSICADCDGSAGCRNHKNARPSMESSGIDVFGTVRNAGFNLKTLRYNDDYVKYFALLLVE